MQSKRHAKASNEQNHFTQNSIAMQMKWNANQARIHPYEGIV